MKIWTDACWNPYFCSVWWLWMGTKKDHFPKTDSCNENARFVFTFRAQIVLAYFLKNAILTKKLFYNHPKNTIFHLFFSIFLSFLFCFSQQKRQKNVFFQHPFWHLDNLQNKSHPYTLFVFLDTPKTLWNWGGNKQKNLGQIFGPDFWLKKGQILDRFLTLQQVCIYICVYIYIYIYRCLVAKI